MGTGEDRACVERVTSASNVPKAGGGRDPAVHRVPVGEGKARLATAGQIVPEADLAIAATALSRGATRVTGNREHCHRIPGPVLEHWRRP